MEKIENKIFDVAFSFPGEKRNYISKIANYLKDVLGPDKVFYDYFYQSQLAKPGIDVVLQNIYKNNSKLIVIALCEE